MSEVGSDAGRIKCPHCGAGNREGAPSSQCWQCGKDLWAPVERGTYALNRLPAMGETQYLGDLPAGPPAAPIPTWKLVTAALITLLTLLLCFAAVTIYLDSLSATRETAPPGISISR